MAGGLRPQPHFDHFGLARRQGSCLVEQHRGDLAGLFQRHAVPNQDAALGGGIGARHDGGRCGQAHRTRTSDYQDSRGDDEGGRQRTGRRVSGPQELRQRVVEARRPAGREAPAEAGGQRHRDHQRHKDTADTVTEPLDVGAAGLGALHGGNDVRQRRFFAGRRYEHHQAPVDVRRARVEPAAGAFVHWHRFTGQHGLIYRRIAFRHFAIGRYAVAGAQDNAVARAQFGHGNLDLGAAWIASAREGGRQVQQLAQGAGRPRTHAGLDPMPQADERDNRGGLHEIEVAAETSEQGPRAVGEGGGGAQRDKGVHVGAANLELSPRAAVELRTSDDLHHAGQRQRTPLEPGRQAEPEHPLSQHQRRGAEDAYPQVELPAAQFTLARLGRMGFGDTGTVTRFFNRLDDGGNTCLSARRPAHGGLVGFEAYDSAVDAGHALDGLGHVPGAVGARHAGDSQLGPRRRDSLGLRLRSGVE